jgi:hypothetical protein
VSQATDKQIRDSYRARGYQCRIRKEDGRITFRKFEGDDNWREGRYASEYIVRNGEVVLR